MGLKSRRSSASPSDNGTIECVVCGAPASAVHYMVWSCNGCKTFFRRAIMENRKYSSKPSKRPNAFRIDWCIRTDCRGIVAVINFILAPIRRIQLTEVEYVFLQTLLLFDTDCLLLSESTRRLRHLFAKMGANSMGSANRMAQLLLRISNIQTKIR
uniref:Nuclear receptor domain-containing protein n=1 Tax=Globodera rostochiensis TaxID=31243 RepID=A0A914H230_GLORO